MFVLFRRCLVQGICLVLSLMMLFGGRQIFVPVAAEGEGQTGVTIVIDAGHGGRDAGAVGVNGVLEKDLNLAYSATLSSLLREAGYEVVETRTEDVLLCKPEDDVQGRRKKGDLKSRLEIGQKQEKCIFISLHMNNFSSSRYQGLQVWYGATDPGSARLAECIRKTVKDHVQPSNERKSKRAGEEIFLLYHATYPAVLIECGFLSHAEECAKLCSESYRKELCSAISCAIMEFLNTIGQS